MAEGADPARGLHLEARSQPLEAVSLQSCCELWFHQLWDGWNMEWMALKWGENAPGLNDHIYQCQSYHDQPKLLCHSSIDSCVYLIDMIQIW